MSEAMSPADGVVRSMCERYASAVNASDSVAYSKLFTQDAIRRPPGSEPEYGPDQIQEGEQADYDVAKWSIRSTPIDALQIAEDWIYGIAHLDGPPRHTLMVRSPPSRPRRRGFSKDKPLANG